MKSLFDKTENASMISRIEKLTADSKPLWGSMSASQMLKHSCISIQNASGELKFERSEMGKKFAEVAKPMIINDEPFGKGLPADENFIQKDAPDFLIEKTAIIAALKKFVEKGHGITSEAEHPFFGELTSDEWDKLMWKHLDHHLRQFGV